MEQTRRRKPASQKWINELNDEDLQSQVRVLGSIVDIQSIQDETQEKISIILDDGTDTIRIILDKSIPLKIGDQIRVYGTLGKTEKEDYILDAEIVQDMNQLDLELYKRVQDVKRRYKNSLKNR